MTNVTCRKLVECTIRKINWLESLGPSAGDTLPEQNKLAAICIAYCAHINGIEMQHTSCIQDAAIRLNFGI